MHYNIHPFILILNLITHSRKPSGGLDGVERCDVKLEIINSYVTLLVNEIFKISHKYEVNYSS